MMSQENKNLILTYSSTLIVAALLVVVIFNFNNWFFPDDELKLSEFTPTSRGMITERDLRFGVLSDQKFTALSPIIDQTDLILEETTESEVSGTAKPSINQPIELRRSNPFLPF